MPNRSPLRDIALIAAALAIGWWAHTPRPAVRAAEYNDVFQFSGAAGEGTLSLYSPSDRTLYVYGGVFSGNGSKDCTYAIKLGRAGEPVQRTNCPVGSLFH